ncbi:MAG: OsmC family protein [Anaerolineae bacterium]
MISISVAVDNSHNSHDVQLTTNGNTHAISVAPKASGYGSSANGGEMLFAALASCYCNDIYREAAKRGITVRRVQVEVSGTFDDAPGSVAEGITYSATVEAEASEADIEALMWHTDTVAEIQNTLRLGTTVRLATVRAVSV